MNSTEKIELLKCIFASNEVDAAKRREGQSLRNSILLNVEFISKSEENNELPQSEQLPSLTELRMVAFVNELKFHNLIREGDLIYADLSLVDHSGESDSISFNWVIGHALGENVSWDDLQKLYEQYAKKFGTSLKSEAYILGEGAAIGSTTAQRGVEKNSFVVLSPTHFTIRSPSDRKTGNYIEYIQSVVLGRAEPSANLNSFVVFHFEAGTTNSFLDVGGARDTCTVHLFLTFQNPEEAAEERSGIDSEIQQVILSQMGRIAGLYLIEKAKVLHEQVESARETERKNSKRLTDQVSQLLADLKKVDSTARALRQSIGSPLARYSGWVEELLPQIFEGTTGLISNLNPLFEDLAAEHIHTQWKQGHVIAALWLLCEPPIPQRIRDAVGAGLSNAEIWNLVIRDAAEHDASDPWFFCASHYASLTGVPLAPMAAMFKSIKSNPGGANANSKEALRLNERLLRFLVGEPLCDKSSLAVHDIRACWNETIFIGFPRLARLIKTGSQKGVNAIFIEEDGKPPVIKITWECGNGNAQLLVNIVQDLLGKLIDKAGSSKESHTSRLLLEESQGKGDMSSAIVRAVSPEKWPVGSYVKRISADRLVIKAKDIEGLLSSFSINEEGEFELLMKPTLGL